MDTHELLTLDELSDYIRTPKATIYAWRKRRTGPVGHRLGRRLIFRRSDVDRWIADQPTHPTKASTAS
jgi:excisionase family DNA binding protein